MTDDAAGLRHPLLERCGVEHAFGTRALAEPPGLVRPRQVHGARVWAIEQDAVPECDAGVPPLEADAVVSSVPGLAVGVVTADCVPLLLSSPRGDTVAAVHAGWRGLARGVVPAAVEALGERTGDTRSLRAVVGPYIGPCCYEIDEPVVEGLTPRFGPGLGSALTATRPGHHRLDMGLLTRQALHHAGLDESLCAALPRSCTHCDSRHFHSYRREGARAGRLVHYIVAQEQG